MQRIVGNRATGHLLAPGRSSGHMLQRQTINEDLHVAGDVTVEGGVTAAGDISTWGGSISAVGDIQASGSVIEGTPSGRGVRPEEGQPGRPSGGGGPRGS